MMNWFLRLLVRTSWAVGLFPLRTVGPGTEGLRNGYVEG